MGKFEFRDRTINIDIAGDVFPVTVTTKVGDTMKGFAQQAKALVSEVASGQKTDADAVKLLTEVIDGILGTGAVKKIFADRELEIIDLCDIIRFVAAEIKEFNEN